MAKLGSIVRSAEQSAELLAARGAAALPAIHGKSPPLSARQCMRRNPPSSVLLALTLSHQTPASLRPPTTTDHRSARSSGLLLLSPFAEKKKGRESAEGRSTVEKHHQVRLLATLGDSSFSWPFRFPITLVLFFSGLQRFPYRPSSVSSISLLISPHGAACCCLVRSCRSQNRFALGSSPFRTDRRFSFLLAPRSASRRHLHLYSVVLAPLAAAALSSTLHRLDGLVASSSQPSLSPPTFRPRFP